MGAVRGQIGVLAAALRVAQVQDVGVATILLVVDRAGQQQLGPRAHIDAGGPAALVAAQPIHRKDVPVAEARSAAIAGLGAVAIRIKPTQAAATRQARRNGGHTLIVRLAALLHLQLLARPCCAFRILGRVAGVAFQANGSQEQLHHSQNP